MNDYGELVAPDTVRFERLLPGPVERVWSFLTESDKRARWFCAGETQLRVGGSIELHFHNAALSNQPDISPPQKYKDLPERMSFSGKVTRCEPPHVLCYTWEEEERHSEVCYELKPAGDKILLVLTHRHLHSRDEILGVSGGWHTHLRILGVILDGKEPEPFWRQHAGLEDEYMRRFEL